MPIRNITDVPPSKRVAKVTFTPITPGPILDWAIESFKPNLLPEEGRRYDSVEDMLKDYIQHD